MIYEQTSKAIFGTARKVHKIIERGHDILNILSFLNENHYAEVSVT